MQETEYIVLEVPKNLLNGQQSVAHNLDKGLEEYETEEGTYNLNELNEMKKVWQGRVSAACRKLVTLQPNSVSDIKEAIMDVKACSFNMALVKEAHSYGNIPINCDIFTREGCVNLQEPLYALQNRFSSKKQKEFKEFVKEEIDENRTKKVAVQGVLNGYNPVVKIKLNLLKV